jgi:hypothetical protein
MPTCSPSSRGDYSREREAPRTNPLQNPTNAVEEADTAPRSDATAPLAMPTGLRSNAVKDISGALNILLADVFALYLKTKNFHWHTSGPHFRDYYLVKLNTTK